MTNWFSKSVLMGILSLSVMTAKAQDPASDPQQHNALTPFNAKYKVSKGRLTLGSAKRQLSQIGDNRYTLSYFSDLSLLILSDHRRETSELYVEEESLVFPSRYLFKREGTGSDKTSKLFFDKNSGEVKDLESQQLIDIDNKVHWYDEISYQLQLKLDLQAGKREMQYYLVNHKKKESHYKFKVVKEERITVPAGTFDTFKLQRIRKDSRRLTEFWIAPELGYLLIRIRQEKDGSEMADAQLEKVAFNPLGAGA